MEFPARRAPFLGVGLMLVLLLVASLFFAVAGSAVGGLVAAAVFAVALVPTARRALDKAPGLRAGGDGIDAHAARVFIPWSAVQGLRHQTLPTPGTGGRGFLAVVLTPDGEPEREGLLAPGVKEGDGGSREVWIPLTGIEAAPDEVLAGVQQARSEARAG